MPAIKIIFTTVSNVDTVRGGQLNKYDKELDSSYSVDANGALTITP